MKLRIAKRFAIMVLNPGAKQDWAMKPSLSSAKQITSSPRFQSQLGMFKRYALKQTQITLTNAPKIGANVALFNRSAAVNSQTG